jgi:Ca-activated chloride channel family protein
MSPLLLITGLALVIIALARPQLENTIVERKAEGIDIMLVLDISTSMKAEDLKPNRFDAAKQVAIDFIDKRISDRIGLAIFARKSFTVVPPTLDYSLVKKMIDEVEMGVVEDGTAIGMGLATGVNRLKDSAAESKVIILLTDGQNNAGEIDPVTAADLAASYEIKIYTIGAGTRGMAPYPVFDAVFGKRYQNIAVDIDEDMLGDIAGKTGGEYFRATDTESLAAIYDRIDALERTEIDELIYTDFKDLYPRYMLPGIVLLILSFVIDRSLLRLELA